MLYPLSYWSNKEIIADVLVATTSMISSLLLAHSPRDLAQFMG